MGGGGGGSRRCPEAGLGLGCVGGRAGPGGHGFDRTNSIILHLVACRPAGARHIAAQQQAFRPDQSCAGRRGRDTQRHGMMAGLAHCPTAMPCHALKRTQCSSLMQSTYDAEP